MNWHVPCHAHVIYLGKTKCGVPQVRTHDMHRLCRCGHDGLMDVHQLKEKVTEVLKGKPEDLEFRYG